MNNYFFLLLLLALSCQAQQHREAPTEFDNYLGEYRIEDADHGTKTNVTIQGEQRIMTTNALPNHQTGSFPNSGNPNRISAQQRTYRFTTKPTYTGEAKWVREPGVAVNGVKFEPGTAEVVQCESGENYRVEALQDLIDLGLDFNHAHVQPTGAYHYHGTPTSLVDHVHDDEDLVHIGFAMDGFMIYYSRSGQYQSSYKLVDEHREGTDCVYRNPHQRRNLDLAHTEADGTYQADWEYVSGLGDLDACNGIWLDGEYAYIVTDEYPYIGRCLMGAYQERRQGPPPGGRRPGGGHPPGGGPPPPRQ
ncbi:MAG: YHYH protein [Bacteroidota bacterium]